MNDPNAPKPDPPDVSTETFDAAILPKVTIPDRIGPYKILERIGEGGMGTVYVAEQRAPVRRRVALKVIKLGMDTKQVLARFEVEHHALAIMNHPNIARVYDAGATAEGRPYFVMEHVAGIPINDYCDRNRLPTRQRLDLFMQVCHGVQHAHQKGVIHRDLKPSNILVMMQDSKPVPKIIDFGVAKATAQPLTERTLYTELGQLVGTPEYMSPEQAEMTAIDIDTRSDVYSLGAILYELLVGALPFDRKTLRKAGYAEIQRIIREVDPPKPSTRLSSLGNEPEPQALACANVEGAKIVRTSKESEPGAQATGLSTPRSRSGLGSAADIARRRRTDLTSLIKQLRGDLDWITMKAMEKDRTRRYETANGLALDIKRHLNHEPVMASPPGAAYRAKKFCRRNKGVIGAATAVFVVLIAGVIVSTSQYLNAVAARDRALVAEQQQSRAREEAEHSRSEAEQVRDEAEQARAEAERQAAIAQAVNDFLNDDLLAAVSPEEQGKDITMRQVLDEASDAIEGKFEDQPLIEASIRTTVGSTYLSLGDYPQAKPHLERALHLRRSELSTEHPDILTSIYNMGLLLWFMGKYAEAEAFYRDALDGRRRVLGDDHPDTLSSINEMGLLLKSVGKLDEAEAYYREDLEGHRRVLGDDHPYTLISIHNMGRLMRELGRLEEAEVLGAEAVCNARRSLPDAWDTAEPGQGHADKAAEWRKKLLSTE